MYQNYVVEIKKSFTGEFEHQIYWLYDDNFNKAMLKAESKYHEILSDAALSNTAMHSAILFTSEGTPIMYQHYEHEEETTE